MPDLTIFQLIGSTAEPVAEESAGIAALGIDPLAILAQAGTFLLLFFIVKKYALEKIIKSLEERRQTIDQGVSLGYEMAEERARLEEKIEAELRKTRDKADAIVADARKEASEVLKAAEVSAAGKVDTMLAEAHVRIEEDMNKAKQDLQKDIMGFVADATEIIIGEKLDARKDDALIKRALKGSK